MPHFCVCGAHDAGPCSHSHVASDDKLDWRSKSDKSALAHGDPGAWILSFHACGVIQQK